MDKLKEKIVNQITETFSFSKGTFDVSTTADLRTVTSINDIKDTDHVFNIIDQKNLDENNLALSDVGGLQVRIGTTLANKILSGENSRTIPHELGHTAGLGHSNNKKNLMSLTMGGDQNSRKEISVSQFYEIRDNYNNRLINKSTAIETRHTMGIQMSKYYFPKLYISTSKYLRK